MFAARSLADIIHEEWRLWSEKLRFGDLATYLVTTYDGLSEQRRLALGVGVMAAGLLIVLWGIVRHRRPTQADLVRKSGARKPSAAEPNLTNALETPEPPPAGPAADSAAEPATAARAVAHAFLVPEERPQSPVPLAAEMVRIGRHEENDVRFGHKTVHRYHAVVHHAGHGLFIIKDLSGAEGNGVYVNGDRIGERSLSPGDLVELGAVRLRFEAASA